MDWVVRIPKLHKGNEKGLKSVMNKLQKQNTNLGYVKYSYFFLILHPKPCPCFKLTT